MLNIPKVPSASAPVAQAAAVSEPFAAPPINPLVIKLAKPIKSHSGELRELKLREPVGADYIEIGRVPFDVRGDGENRRAIVDFKVAAQWISRLTGHDEIVIGMLSSDDWLSSVSRVNALLMRAGISDVGN